MNGASAQEHAGLLAAAFGAPPAAAGADWWGRLHGLAVHHRLAPLVWLRSGREIARHGPEVAAPWRAAYLAAAAHAQRQLSATASLCDELAAAGCDPVVLKGLPLAARLHGDPSARPSLDLDVYVPAAARERAARRLLELGYERALGDAGGDETFQAPGGGLRVELHSALVGDRLRHLPTPPPARREARIEGARVPAFDGDLLPGYLASHLASHQHPPLLWWVDFAALWRSLDAAGRQAARTAASAAGLGRYLAWAVRRADAVGRAAGGDASALRRLGFAGGTRREPHKLLRHLVLSPSPRAALAVARGWALPPWDRVGGARTIARRLARHWRQLLPIAETPASTGAAPSHAGMAARQQTLAPAVLLDAAREVTLAGGELWLTLTGQSMVPAMLPGDRILLGPPRTTRRGDVVLGEVCGRPVIHRVRRAGRGAVVMQGDACRLADPPMRPEQVVGRVIASERGGRYVAHEATLRFGSAALGRGLWLRVRAPLARARRRLPSRPAGMRHGTERRA